MFVGCSQITGATTETIPSATIDYLHITANVSNGYAITTVEEKLTNPHDTATDDEFRFLIPEGAFISGFSMLIDGVEYIADVLPKEEAEKSFEEANVKYISSNQVRVTYSAKSLPDQDLGLTFTTDNTSLSGEMLFYETGGTGYLMHVFSPSVTDLGTTAISKEIIFVIDRSGSMRGDKIAQVKRVFTDIITDLPPDDYFNVIFFYDNVMVFRDTLMEANTQTKAEAVNFVDSLESSGGTNINEALIQALGMFEPGTGRVPIIIFLTDGEPTKGVKSPYVIRDNIKAANEAEVSIFTIAFGIDDEDNYDFLRALSLENYGVAQRLYPDENAETEMNTFYKTISTPVITDMDWSISDTSVVTFNT